MWVHQWNLRSVQNPKILHHHYHPASYSIYVMGILIRGVKRWEPEADHLRLLNAKAKNEWRYSSITPYKFMVCLRLWSNLWACHGIKNELILFILLSLYISFSTTHSFQYFLSSFSTSHLFQYFLSRISVKVLYELLSLHVTTKRPGNGTLAFYVNSTITAATWYTMFPVRIQTVTSFSMRLNHPNLRS
jgi:hypothetical protein